MNASPVTGAPRVLLRLEGLAVLAAAMGAFAWTGGSWWLFAALFFLPDLSMAGYLAGNKAGAALYNAAHWYAIPLACCAFGLIGHTPLMIGVGLVWAAHIGFDRALGYGLKYGQGFGSSHLGAMGKGGGDR